MVDVVALVISYNYPVMKKTLFLGLLLFACLTARAQDQSSDDKTKKYYTNNPVWTQMMKDPNVNFFEVNKAFEIYWEDREKPELEREGGEEKEEEKERSLFSRLIKSDKKEEAERNEYAFAYKQYIKWRIEVEPFVQPDGRILSAEEQHEVWEKSR
ncbi:MAG: hypothetical protein K0R51_1160 [Cytophagaceae bacterium]|jgi:hypothetical protein|nr:hypothetical protein [Cytophagaceae bacterium]